MAYPNLVPSMTHESFCDGCLFYPKGESWFYPTTRLWPPLCQHHFVLSYCFILHSIIGLSRGILEKIFFDANAVAIRIYGDFAGGGLP